MWRRPVCAVLAATGLTACAQPSAKADPRTVTVWNLDGQPDRMAAVKKINAAFTARTGTTVEEVAVQENQLPSLITSAAVSGTMPDLISGLPLAYLRQLKQQKLLDTKAASQVVEKLGAATFAAKALELTRDGNNQLGVPSDAWTQILVYRKDLFAAKHLAAPTTYEAIEKAAEALTSGSQYGITLATDPSDPFTQQTFESLALGNNCQMVEREDRSRWTVPPVARPSRCTARWPRRTHHRAPRPWTRPVPRTSPGRPR